MGRRPKTLEKLATTQTKDLEQGEGELFKVHVIKVSNGYIIESEQGGKMVFSDDKYQSVIEWIVSRRLKQMQPGDEIDLTLEQRFTKITKEPSCTNETQKPFESQLVA